MQDIIEQNELRLKEAMLQSDVQVLDELLADSLIFTNHLGHLMTKQDDLNAHQSEVLKINKLQLSEQVFKVYEHMAVVSAKTFIAGSFAGESSSADFRFTRVWSRIEEKWQVVAGHSCLVS